MNTHQVMNMAQKAAATAKDGTLIVDGKRYQLTFDHKQWLYLVTLEGETVTNFNTKSLKCARQWLREYLAN